MTRSSYPEGYVHQHTLFEKRTMQARSDTNEWRHHPGMIIVMPESDEKALHRELPGLPLPSRLLARRALEHLNALPPDFGRLNMFNSVVHLMYDIADRNEGSKRGEEAQIFAQHFQDQKIFFGGALTRKDEVELFGG